MSAKLKTKESGRERDQQRAAKGTSDPPLLSIWFVGWCVGGLTCSLLCCSSSFFPLPAPVRLCQTALVMSHVDLEESSQKLTTTNKALQVKAQMCAVFESGLSDLRAMLEAEIEEKDKYKTAFDDLARFQKTTKLTWVPDQAATHCMACKKKFSRFGSGSKGHCRYCGRVFCRACCTESPIPELNFMAKVKICKPCDAFRRKASGERQAEAAAEQEEEDDEDEAPAAKGGRSAASPRPAAGGKGKPSVLSYDSDELE